MLDLRKPEQAILANGRVNIPELGELRRHMCAADEIDRRETDFLTAPAESAKAAGLRYVSDTVPGIARIRTGKGFSYIDTGGKRIGQVSVLERIKTLAIPPAWIKVWICADPDGHLQADGRDTRPQAVSLSPPLAGDSRRNQVPPNDRLRACSTAHPGGAGTGPGASRTTPTEGAGYGGKPSGSNADPRR